MFIKLKQHHLYTTLAKKIETATQAKHRRVHAREITRLRHVHTAVSIFLARVVGLLTCTQCSEDPRPLPLTLFYNIS